MKVTPGAPPTKRAAMAVWAKRHKQYISAMKARALEAAGAARISRQPNKRTF